VSNRVQYKINRLELNMASALKMLTLKGLYVK
jgi:hypothetical protein